MYRSAYWAKQFNNQWLQQVKESLLDDINRLPTCLIVMDSSFSIGLRPTNAILTLFVESFNNRAKLAMRKVFGFK